MVLDAGGGTAVCYLTLFGTLIFIMTIASKVYSQIHVDGHGSAEI